LAAKSNKEKRTRDSERRTPKGAYSTFGFGFYCDIGFGSEKRKRIANPDFSGGGL
jgi:hypothetical protein